MIYGSNEKAGYKMESVFDPNSIRSIGIIYRPANWAASTVYYRRSNDDYDICVPSVFTGFYHKVSNPGLSGAVEPAAWSTTGGGLTTDGNAGLIWEAVPYNLMVPSLTITASTWTVSGQLPAWTATTALAVGKSVQATANGDQFIVTAITTGITGSVEPTWNVGAGLTTTNGGVTFTYVQSIPFVTGTSIVNGVTKANINGGPNVTLTTFTVTNTTTKSDGTKDDVSIVFKVAPR